MQNETFTKLKFHIYTLSHQGDEHDEAKKTTLPMKHKMIVMHDSTIEVDESKVEIVDVESINLGSTSKQPQKA